MNLNPVLPGSTYNSEGTSWQPTDIESIGYDPGREHSRRPGYERRYEGSSRPALMTKMTGYSGGHGRFVA